MRRARHMLHASPGRSCPRQAWPGLLWGALCLLAGLLVSCNSSGDGGPVTPPAEPGPALQQHTVAELLTLYRTALRQADIDRLDTLLQSDPPPAPAAARLQPATRSTGGTVLDAPTFRDAIATLLRTVTITESGA